MDNALRARLCRPNLFLNLFLDIYADLPPEWQERVEREVRAVCLELLGLGDQPLDPPAPIP